jgi:hypothetical protein
MAKHNDAAIQRERTQDIAIKQVTKQMDALERLTRRNEDKIDLINESQGRLESATTLLEIELQRANKDIASTVGNTYHVHERVKNQEPLLKEILASIANDGSTLNATELKAQGNTTRLETMSDMIQALDGKMGSL